ncbi:VRR-NUC domain-containing protein [Eubacterium sp. AB3007]|uniref:VRR-NUC domain-containing protein n=1 Tax=Eubacterium sp. AB3007 TaxID=1392487 RepID=UPI000484B079|nr:VRR-NUC domain-containing protein [Eubacterium sp. AB3007]
MSALRERDIEKKLVREVRAADGLALKFISPGCSGVPDRIVLLPGGRMCFAELKAPGRKMRPLQMRRKEMLEALGFQVFCIDSMEGITDMMKEVMPSEVQTT